jgi:hypothetical protein
MKKIAIMALAVVLALGALGVGYALWYQDIIISGTVNTGTVNISVCNPSGTLVYKDIDGANDGVLVKVDGVLEQVPTLPYSDNVTIPAEVEIYGGDDAILIAVAQAVGLEECIDCDVPNGSVTVNVEYYNLFPLDQGEGWFCADFDMTNTGSIPVKAKVLADWAPSGIGILSFHPYTYDDTGEPIELEGYQVDPGETITVEVCIDVPDDLAAQSLSGGFTATIQFQQWNEYVSPPG